MPLHARNPPPGASAEATGQAAAGSLSTEPHDDECLHGIRLAGRPGLQAPHRVDQKVFPVRDQRVLPKKFQTMDTSNFTRVFSSSLTQSLLGAS